jgi:CCR4-NOT transcription complex subunit 7/8
LQLHFPHFYDIKYIISSVQPKISGLQDLATSLGVPRVGSAHQAGSDSHLTLMTFFKLMEKHFGGVLKNDDYRNLLYRGVNK